MEKTQLISVYFKQLKGLHDVQIEFAKPLTAIMGVNGAGKTTIIHALACMFQPEGNGENNRFSRFFIPNTDSTWKNSEMTVTIENEKKTRIERTYSKKVDRWAPRYENRPKKNVYYIGIDSCLPEIERNNATAPIQYRTEKRSDKVATKVIQKAAYVLNIDYQDLTDNKYKNRNMIGVTTGHKLQYSSLSMGTGEQRTIKILETVLSAEVYSLILVDEIDLLLHPSAFKRLIEQLYTIAVDRHLQIVFTTHSLEVEQMREHLSIQYIENVKISDGSERTMVYNEISSDLIYKLSETHITPITIYVEDLLSASVVKAILREKKMSAKAKVVTFGSIENGFTLAAGLILKGEDISNVLIVLDGDRHKSQDEKLSRIKSLLSGTENDAEERQTKALSCITQYNLPEGKSPEQHIHEMLCSSDCEDSELLDAAKEIHAVSDSHEWIDMIAVKLNSKREEIVHDIVGLISKTEKWAEYIKPIADWLESKRAI